MKIRGLGVSPGIAIGKALILVKKETSIFKIPLRDEEIEQEIQKFKNAIVLAEKQILSIRDKIGNDIGKKYSFIFDAHLLILQDEVLINETANCIKTQKVNVEWALKKVVENLLKSFKAIDDPFFKERGGDIEDIYKRLQGILSGSKDHHKLSDLSEDAIVVAHSLSPSDTVMLNTDHIIAFATDLGGRTSHTAILANALEIPAIVGLHDIFGRINNGDLIIVDGTRGEFIHNPDEDELSSYQHLKEDYEKEEVGLLELKDLPAVTKDGVEITLMANIELPYEIDSIMKYGAQGIGLYRSEFLYITKSPELPSEKDHFQLYKEIAERIYPREALIRTLDLGGEKYSRDVLGSEEANPFMGLRAIRFCLRRKDIFKAQLRGILAASAYGNIKVMFPMISTLEELQSAKKILDEAKEELRHEGIPFNEGIPVGIMIEVPSAAMIADMLAKEVQFFSIGTNDLIQYAMAADRGNESVSYLYQPLHPSILRILKFVIDSAQDNKTEISICGEMASDPFYTPALIGLGLRNLSMNPIAIPKIKEKIRQLNTSDSSELVKKALTMQSSEEIVNIFS
jgi:phosphotransferase system enzyme I (PtsI)